MKRSLTDYANTRFANETSMLTLLRDPQDIWTFENVMQGDPDMPELGVHGGGHWSFGMLDLPLFVNLTVFSDLPLCTIFILSIIFLLCAVSLACSISILLQLSHSSSLDLAEY